MPTTKIARYFKWYHLFYILAVFGVATISFSLFLNHVITEKYKASIELDRIWSLRLKQLFELGRIAADVNAPGNDVFANRDVAGERARLAKSLALLSAKMTEVQEEFRQAGLLNSKTSKLLALDILRLDRRLGELSQEATRTIKLFDEKKLDEASRQMAVMDHRYYCANSALRTMAIHISDIQQSSFENQSRELEFLRLLERCVAAGVFVMILAVTGYGHKLSKQIIRNQIEKQHHLVQLQDAHDGLGRKADELQEALGALQNAQIKVVESERKFQAIFDHSFEFIGLMSCDGILLEANQTSLGFAGVSRDEVVGLPFWETPWWSHSKELQEKLQSAISEAAGGKLVRFETTHPSKSGAMIAVDFSVKPVFDDEGKVVMLIPEGRDISEKKQAEIRVSEFYSTVSHELRTPLTSIRGSLGLIGGGLAGATTEKTQMLVTIACEETDRLIRLINGILDLRKIEAGMLDFDLTEVESSDLIEKTIKVMSGMAYQAGIELTVGDCCNVRIECDEDRVIQVLTNLISNAIKFSDRGQTVIIEVAQQEPELVRFSVKDNGPGIPAEQKHKLFGKFQQIDQSDRRKKDGSGLGLAISKALVEQHGGTIGLSDGESGGTTFWFDLPIQSTTGRSSRIEQA